MKIKKISELGSATQPLSGSEKIVMNQSGSTFTSTVDSIKDYIGFGNDITVNSVTLSGGVTFQRGLAVTSFSIGQITEGGSPLSGIHVTSIGLDNCKGNTGNNILSIGDHACAKNTGHNIISLGPFSCTSYMESEFNSGSYVIAIGAGSCTDNSGSNVLAIGSNSGSYNSGDSLISVGENAANYNQGSDVISIGRSAGHDNTGDHNIFIGDSTRTYPFSLSGCIVIGSNAMATESNQLALGSSEVPLTTVTYTQSLSSVRASKLLQVNINGTPYFMPLYPIFI